MHSIFLGRAFSFAERALCALATTTVHWPRYEGRCSHRTGTSRLLSASVPRRCERPRASCLGPRVASPSCRLVADESQTKIDCVVPGQLGDRRLRRDAWAGSLTSLARLFVNITCWAHSCPHAVPEPTRRHTVKQPARGSLATILPEENYLIRDRALSCIGVLQTNFCMRRSPGQARPCLHVHHSVRSISALSAPYTCGSI